MGCRSSSLHPYSRQILSPELQISYLIISEFTSYCAVKPDWVFKAMGLSHKRKSNFPFS